MQSVFGIVIFSVVGISGVIAIGTFLFGGQPPHSSIGGGSVPLAPGAEPSDMKEDDVRQMLEARNRRRLARGETVGDLDSELRDLMTPTPSHAVAGEVRAEAEAIIGARRARRRRRGQPEGDFEEELAELLRTISDV